LILQALKSHTVRSKPSSVLRSDMVTSPPDNVDRIHSHANNKVRLSRRRTTEAASPSHRRLRRYPACPELSEGRLIASHLFPPVSRRAAAACVPAFRIRRFHAHPVQSQAEQVRIDLGLGPDALKRGQTDDRVQRCFPNRTNLKSSNLLESKSTRIYTIATDSSASVKSASSFSRRSGAGCLNIKGVNPSHHNYPARGIMVPV
jgi:hypothetical protein